VKSNIRAWGATETGKKRRTNQDSFFINAPRRLMAVADGMGGAAAGELASRLFVDTLKGIQEGELSTSARDAGQLVQRIFRQANRKIREHIRSNPDHEGMGCTAEVLFLYPGGFLVGHVGDSRTYRYRQGGLTQLSTDHSFIQEQLHQGVITREEARNHRMRHVILRAVGTEDEVQVDLIQGLHVDGDIYLLCSDGLTDMVEDRTIQEVLQRQASLEHKGRCLMDKALSEGGLDNITLVLAEVANRG
jgi:protein phosphatase